MPCLSTSDTLPAPDSETASCATHRHSCRILRTEIPEAHHCTINPKEGQGYMALFLTPSVPASFVAWRSVVPVGQTEQLPDAAVDDVNGSSTAVDSGSTSSHAPVSPSLNPTSPKCGTPSPLGLPTADSHTPMGNCPSSMQAAQVCGSDRQCPEINIEQYGMSLGQVFVLSSNLFY
jgi:hypothetical protein